MVTKPMFAQILPPPLVEEGECAALGPSAIVPAAALITHRSTTIAVGEVEDETDMTTGVEGIILTTGGVETREDQEMGETIEIVTVGPHQEMLEGVGEIVVIQGTWTAVIRGTWIDPALGVALHQIGEDFPEAGAEVITEDDNCRS